MIAGSFETWFEGERANGLVDFKPSIRRAPGATLAAVQNEIMALDADAKANGSQPFPEPAVFLPKRVKDLMDSVSL